MHVDNPNLSRRRLPVLALALAYPWLRLFLLLARRNGAVADPGRVTLFQSYQVGDFYMALPAIRLLAGRIPVRVLCRPDCVFLLRGLGIEALPFPNPFPVEPGLSTFLSGLKGALALRSILGPTALDFHADPRTAFLLKAAGARRVRSFRRPFGWFIDGDFPIPADRLHQSEKDMAVAEGFLERAGAGNLPITDNTQVTPSAERPGPSAARAQLVVSCWTRRDEKNWPLESWSRLIDALSREGRSVCVIVPPDGDEAFRAFRERWRDQSGVEFLETGLEGIHRRVGSSGGVLCTDNFLGHMASYLGKPVFWINGSSDPVHVRPYGAGTEVVQSEPMPCRPCRHHCVNPVYKKCLLELSPDTVLSRVEAWLERNAL
jgi:ADP-heptose:LPS heptosyltransferase